MVICFCLNCILILLNCCQRQYLVHVSLEEFIEVSLVTECVIYFCKCSANSSIKCLFFLEAFVIFPFWTWLKSNLLTNSVKSIKIYFASTSLSPTPLPPPPSQQLPRSVHQNCPFSPALILLAPSQSLFHLSTIDLEKLIIVHPFPNMWMLFICFLCSQDRIRTWTHCRAGPFSSSTVI